MQWINLVSAGLVQKWCIGRSMARKCADILISLHISLWDLKLAIKMFVFFQERKRTHPALTTPSLPSQTSCSKQSGERDVSCWNASDRQRSSDSSWRAENFVKFRLCQDASEQVRRRETLKAMLCPYELVLVVCFCNWLPDVPLSFLHHLFCEVALIAITNHFHPRFVPSVTDRCVGTVWSLMLGCFIKNVYHMCVNILYLNFKPNVERFLLVLAPLKGLNRSIFAESIF